MPTVSSRLIRLPTELLLLLFSHIDDPIEQLCLALTCKRLLQVSSFVVVKIPSVSKHRYLPPPFCDRMLMLMRRLAPSGARGLRQKRTLALCCDCLRYQSTKKSYWKKDGKRYTTAKPGVGAWKIWDSTVWSWTSWYSFQCPACWLRERI